MVATSIRLRDGDRYAIAAPNGAGKSTLLSVLSLMHAPDTAVRFEILRADGTRIDLAFRGGHARKDVLQALRAREIGSIRHAGMEVPFLTVNDYLALRLRLAGRASVALPAAVTESLGLAPLLAAKPRQLSQGQRQRMAIAAALAPQPRFVFADEPTASLDAQWAPRVMDLLAQYRSAQGRGAVLVATHDPDLAAAAGFTVIGPQDHAVDENGVATWTFAVGPEARIHA